VTWVTNFTPLEVVHHCAWPIDGQRQGELTGNELHLNFKLAKLALPVAATGPVMVTVML
jgi:hypothetical protein